MKINHHNVCIKFGTCEVRRLNQPSHLRRIFDSVEDATEIAFNSNLPNLIDLDVELYMHLIHKLNSAHVKCDV